MKIKLAKSEIIHFVGIGGIGMSGLSLIMKGKGFKVQGSDVSNNKNIEYASTKASLESAVKTFSTAQTNSYFYFLRQY